MKQGWEIKKLGDVCDLMTGGTPSKSKPEYFLGGNIKWLVSGDINKGEIFDCDGRITQEGMDSSNTKYLPVNSVLIALNGQGKTRGTVALLRTKATCNQSLVSIFPKKGMGLLPEYLYCNLHGRYDEIRKITGDSGNDRRGLNMPLIRSLEIPIAPLPEQQCIVSILDEAFTAIAKAKANAEQNLKNAKELFENYLQGVFENKGEGWEAKTLGEIANVEYGYTDKSTDEGDYRYIRITDIGKSGEQIQTEKKYIKRSKEAEGFLLQDNDLLMARTGATFAKVLLFKNYEPSVFASYLIRITFKEKIENELYWFFTKTKNYWEQANALSSGAAQPHFNGAAVKQVIFSYPKTVNEQKLLINKFKTLSVETKKIETIYQQKLNDLEELKKSLLQKAFSGELKVSIPISNFIDFPVKISNISITDLHAGIIALALQRHQDKNRAHTFHHVKSEKIIHMAESFVGIDLERNPFKDAAGPNDFPKAKKVESRASKAGFFTLSNNNGIYVYNKGNQFDKLIDKAKLALNNQLEKLLKLIDLMVPMTTQQAEIFATVYAAWNNLLLDGKQITDESIVTEARENWHKDKLKIPREKFFNAIAWMKKQNIIPEGKGKRVLAKTS